MISPLTAQYLAAVGAPLATLASLGGGFTLLWLLKREKKRIASAAALELWAAERLEGAYVRGKLERFQRSLRENA
jgi:hypothetical protein